MHDDFTAFKNYGNFHYFALTLHLNVLSSKKMLAKAKDEYTQYSLKHDDDFSFVAEHMLHSEVLNAQHNLDNVQDIENTFVSLLSDEAKNYLPEIWLIAEKAFEKTNQHQLRKAG